MKAIAGLVAGLLLFGSTSLAQTASTQTADSAQPTVAAAAGDPAGVTPADVTPGDAAPAVHAVPFGPGVKLFLEPMDGYAELMSEAITKKKVPVVLVHDRAEADFVMSGDAHLKKPGFFKGMMLYPHAKANVEISDAHTGDVVFAYVLDEKQEGMSAGYVYVTSAYNCAKHLKKAMVKK